MRTEEMHTSGIAATAEARRSRPNRGRWIAAIAVETIHGDAMPGLAVLEANFAALETTYRERADGAEVTYRSSDPAVVTALHDWFDAQLSDHGTHAQPG